MRISKAILVVITLFLLPVNSYSSDLGALRTSLIEGDVQIKIEDTSEWVPAAINMPLQDGDRLWVPESARLELQLSDGSFLRLDEDSSLVIHAAEKGSFQFYLTEGHAYINFRGIRDSILQIDTPASSVRVYDRSNFRIDLPDYGYTEISVLKGVVYAETRDGKTRVNAGKTLSLKEDNYAEISPLGPFDEWERWNRDRDIKFEDRRYSSRYLPEELEIYSYDFDENGRWVSTREYGYVWTPTVIISTGWSPYRNGRWTWIRGDYVWVSYESWGWVPYHYGRWAFIGSIGWSWVPPARGAVYWGPGFVGWVHTPTYVAWVPLAPGDIYYGYGYYGHRSVNILNINIHKTVIKNKYRNVHVHNAVTVLHHDTFIRGKHLNFRIKKNPFLHEKISIGRPKIKPVSASFMPIIKEIPDRKQPRETVRKIHVKEFKKRRLVKKRTDSVLSPESPQKIMPVRHVKETIRRSSGTKKYRKSVPKEQIQNSEKYETIKHKSIRRDKGSKRQTIEKQPRKSRGSYYSVPQRGKQKQVKLFERQHSSEDKKVVTQKKIKGSAVEKKWSQKIYSSSRYKDYLKGEKIHRYRTRR